MYKYKCYPFITLFRKSFPSQSQHLDAHSDRSRQCPLVPKAATVPFTLVLLQASLLLVFILVVPFLLHLPTDNTRTTDCARCWDLLAVEVHSGVDDLLATAVVHQSLFYSQPSICIEHSCLSFPCILSYTT